MKYKSEEQIKKALEIDSFRSIPKEKILKFAAMMPDMDKEVSIKIIEQFPEFAKFANESLDTMEEEYKSTLSSNQESQRKVHDAFREIREILKGELKQEDLSVEEKKYILELIMKTGEMESEKDSENKKFLNGMFKNGLAGIGAVVLGAIVFVGGKVLLERGDK